MPYRKRINFCVLLTLPFIFCVFKIEAQNNFLKNYHFLNRKIKWELDQKLIDSNNTFSLFDVLMNKNYTVLSYAGSSPKFGSKLLIYNNINGKKIWQFNVDNDFNWDNIILKDDFIFIPDFDGISQFNLINGKKKTFSIGHSIHNFITISSKYLYVRTKRKSIKKADNTYFEGDILIKLDSKKLLPLDTLNIDGNSVCVNLPDSWLFLSDSGSTINKMDFKNLNLVSTNFRNYSFPSYTIQEQYSLPHKFDYGMLLTHTIPKDNVYELSIWDTSLTKIINVPFTLLEDSLNKVISIIDYKIDDQYLFLLYSTCPQKKRIC